MSFSLPALWRASKLAKLFKIHSAAEPAVSAERRAGSCLVQFVDATPRLLQHRQVDALDKREEPDPEGHRIFNRDAATAARMQKGKVRAKTPLSMSRGHRR